MRAGIKKAILISVIIVEINKPLLRDPVTDFSWARNIVRIY